MTGLPNLGNTCYINSILQCLRYQRNFVKQLKYYDTKQDCALDRHFVDLLFTDSSNTTLRNFVHDLALKKKEFALFRQSDAHEFYMFIIDHFYETHKIKNPFKGTLESCVFCDCGYSSKTKQDFVSISILPKEQPVEDLISEFEKEEQLDIECNCQRLLKKKLKIIDYPLTLVVHLKRFTNSNIKVNAKITLDDYKNYTMTAVCNHSGNTCSGHYTAAVKRSHGGWYMYNDIHVQELSHLPKKSELPYILFFEKYKRSVCNI